MRSMVQGSLVLLGYEFRRAVLQELHLSDQFLQQGHVAVLVQIHLQRHLSFTGSVCKNKELSARLR